MSTEPFPVRDSLISRQQKQDRDYAIYTQHRRRFTNILRRILTSYDMDVSTNQVEELVDSVPHFEETGLMNLLSEDMYSDNTPIQKGILGAIIASRWLQAESENSLILSIDDRMSREWLNLRQTNQRADFLLVQLDGDEIKLDIVEAKAHDTPDNVFTVRTQEEVADGEDDGNNDDQEVVSGKAVRQLQTTQQTLEAIFAGQDNLATSARKEVLRKQIYYALRNNSKIDNQSEWTNALNSFFDSGDNSDNVSARIVSVELDSTEASVKGKEVSTSDGDDIILDRLRIDILEKLLQEDEQEDEETDC